MTFSNMNMGVWIDSNKNRGHKVCGVDLRYIKRHLKFSVSPVSSVAIFKTTAGLPPTQPVRSVRPWSALHAPQFAHP